MFYELLWRKFFHISGNIGDIPADSGHVIPVEPELEIFGIDIFGIQKGKLKNMSVHIYLGTNSTPVFVSSINSTSEDQTNFNVSGKIQGNFKVRIDHKPGMFKAKKAFELWHNTLFIEP